MDCPLCGYKAKQLDEHIETHHSKYDFAKILQAILKAISNEKNAGGIKAVQYKIRRNLEDRLQKALANLKK